MIIFNDETTLCERNDCDWEGPSKELRCQLWDIPDLFERIAPGETVPAGECPVCGVLASVKGIRAVMIDADADAVDAPPREPSEKGEN
jgi:hypothetical protein